MFLELKNTNFVFRYTPNVNRDSEEEKEDNDVIEKNVINAVGPAEPKEVN